MTSKLAINRYLAEGVGGRGEMGMATQGAVDLMKYPP